MEWTITTLQAGITADMCIGLHNMLLHDDSYYDFVIAQIWECVVLAGLQV